MPASTERMRREARALFVAGMAPEQIADVVGRSASSVYRWMAADGDWDRLRQARRTQDPVALIAILDARLAEIAEDRELSADPASWADSLQKLSNVRDRIASRVGNLPTVLGVLSRFANWAGDSGQVSDEDLRALSRATESYLAHLKEENP